ncbi:MAG: response regulator transcription factor [Bacteroidales bacterium]|jgi:two-component system alkaline phosphatase synthesis response regulator PhoP|nr:response regulator transcription factor [Bacteroidales bacterium]MDD4002096.1 response regulator transcription factor [Bacteroidales bacterium]MDD4528685.1 response regulator transcription factor [Bacteroidales bacterium]MDD4830029.1 response regulator transcription factor [Bacteroidales bacterium]
MIEHKYKVLVVDDEEDILEFLSFALSKDGFEVKTATSGTSAIPLAKEFKPDIIILDVMMPGIDGIETCSQLREIKELENMMIVFLTARNEDYSQIAGFEAGADDYVSKPIKPKVLSSRLKALLRRNTFQTHASESNNLLVRNDLIIDKDRYLVKLKDSEVTLSKKEFELLYFLASKPNKVFSRDEIYSAVWEDGIIVGERTIDVHIRKLRDKLKIDNIKTYKGVGYKYEE